MPAIHLTQRSSDRPFDVTTDPFAIFGFMLLIVSVIVAAIVLTVISRRSAESDWNFAKRTKAAQPRLRKLVLVEEGLPLMSQQLPSSATNETSMPVKPSRAAQQAAKAVHFSQNDVKPDQSTQDEGRSVTPTDSRHEPDFEDVDLGHSARQTWKESQIAKMQLSNGLRDAAAR